MGEHTAALDTSDSPLKRDWARLAGFSDEVVLAHDSEGNLLFVDPSVRWALGYAPEDFTHISTSRLVHPEDLPTADEAWLAAIERPGEEIHAEYRVRLADGSWRWFEARIQNLLDDREVLGVVVHMRDIHDRREALEELKASEERFRAVVQHSYDAVVLSDERNSITYVTPAVRSMFGWEPEQLLGEIGFTFVHPADRAETVRRARALLQTAGARSEIDFRIRQVDGTYRWVECTSVNLLDHPYVRSIVNSFRDIDDRRRADEQLRASEERLAALLRNSDGAVIVSNSEGVVTWASASSARIWGIDESEMVGRAMVEYIHPDDRREVIRQFRKMSSAPDLSVRVEGRMHHGDGTWRWYECVFTNCLDDPAVGGIVANVRDTTERALADRALRESEGRLDHQATHDHLTDLPNRTLFFDRLEIALGRASRLGSLVAAIFVDLDNFKVINDSQGHGFGDEVIMATASRLAASLRPGDSLARFGGDEFVILCEDLRGERDAVAIGETILRSFDEPLVAGSAEVFVTASLGIALTDGSGSEPEHLVRDADAAMYQAKEHGRNRFELFDAGMRARAVERHQLETSLRRAVARKQLQIHYQPIVSLVEGRVTAVEALVRWKHPSRGLLYPGTFISIAEETGLIVPLGAWIFDAACCEVSRWSDFHPEQRDLRVHINLSARQLAEPSLTDDIANVLAATPLDPRQVYVEVTESVLMRDMQASLEMLDRIRVLGVRVAIDDFGTGYSSFSHLTNLPVDILKIDRSFIIELGRRTQAGAVVGAIINLAHTLGIEVVAEGVENATQLTELRRLGCDAAQGFLFAGALPPRKLHDFLRRRPIW